MNWHSGHFQIPAVHSDPWGRSTENRLKPFVEQDIGWRPHFHVCIRSFIHPSIHSNIYWCMQVPHKILRDTVVNKIDPGCYLWSSRGDKHLQNNHIDKCKTAALKKTWWLIRRLPWECHICGLRAERQALIRWGCCYCCCLVAKLCPTLLRHHGL